MEELFVRGRTLAEAYHHSIEALYRHGEICECPDYNQKQKECSTFNSSSRTIKCT